MAGLREVMPPLTLSMSRPGEAGSCGRRARPLAATRARLSRVQFHAGLRWVLQAVMGRARLFTAPR